MKKGKFFFEKGKKFFEKETREMKKGKIFLDKAYQILPYASRRRG